MTTVEKAAERLKAALPQAESSPDVDVAAVPPETADPGATTIDRWQERQDATFAGDVVEPSAPCHVDLDSFRKAGLLPAGEDAARRLSDELRRIKRPLLDNVAGKQPSTAAHPRRIVVTSAVPGEGKTFTAVNLALSLAREPDFEVLLVDADIPKADATRSFGLDGRPGLMDVLAEQREPADVIVPTDIPNLMVVPIGTRHALTAELFGSLRMDYTLEVFGGRNPRRLVVFDSSPLLATAEAQVLASHMGQVVVVVAAGRTPRHAVDAALRTLSPSQFVGLVLNMSRLPLAEDHYDSYYGRHVASGQQGEA